jgi:hypothetical protein
MENVGILYGHLVYFVAIGNVVVIWYNFSPLWYIVSRKIWQPWFVLMCLEILFFAVALESDFNCNLNGQTHHRVTNGKP